MLSINKSVARQNGKLVISTPKTPNSIRTVLIPADTVKLLVEEHERHPANPYLFPSPRTGRRGIRMDSAGCMTVKMQSTTGEWGWNNWRDTPQASLAPCRCAFPFAKLAKGLPRTARLPDDVRQNVYGRTAVFLAPLMPGQNKKAIPFGMTFCFGGDKRDRTADLMTASCDRFVILSVFTPNTSVQSVKSAEFYKALATASTRVRAHLGHNLGQTIQSTQTVVRILIKRIFGFVIRIKSIDQISKEYRGHFIFRDVYL